LQFISAYIFPEKQLKFGIYISVELLLKCTTYLHSVLHNTLTCFASHLAIISFVMEQILPTHVKDLFTFQSLKEICSSAAMVFRLWKPTIVAAVYQPSHQWCNDSQITRHNDYTKVHYFCWKMFHHAPSGTCRCVQDIHVHPQTRWNMYGTSSTKSDVLCV